MLRRLLTCLALITGLAALDAPVNASAADTMCAQIGSAATQAATGQAVKCECIVRPGTRPTASDPVATCKARKPVMIYIPTVQFGADRAYE